MRLVDLCTLGSGHLTGGYDPAQSNMDETRAALETLRWARLSEDEEHIRVQVQDRPVAGRCHAAGELEGPPSRVLSRLGTPEISPPYLTVLCSHSCGTPPIHLVHQWMVGATASQPSSTS